MKRKPSETEEKQPLIAESLSHVTKEIISYVNDSKHDYAIGLEGDWGSGKTRYLETVVRKELNEIKRKMLRVSMFGIKSAEELYERISVAFFRLDNNEDKWNQAKKTGLMQIPNAAKTGLAALGIDLTFNASMKAFVDLALDSEKHVLVFDDLERSIDGENGKALFGAINDLVENKKIKAIVVSSSFPTGEKNKNETLDSTIREKLIWRVYSFSPDPSALVGDVLGTISSSCEEIDWLGEIGRAANDIPCRNARAILKAERLVREICCLPCLASEDIALDSRRSALYDAAKHTLLICMGKEPTRPDDYTPSGSFSPEAIEHHMRVEDYERYSDLPPLAEYIRGDRPISSEAFDAEMRAYIAKRYPDSSDTIEMTKITEMHRFIYMFSDDDVNKALPRFVELVQRAQYSATILKDVIVFNTSLRDIGFEGLCTNEDLLASGRRVIDADPAFAFDFFRDHMPLIISFSDRQCVEMLEELDEYARSAYSKKALEGSALAIDASKPECGSTLAHALEESWQRGVDFTLHLPPDFIVECFVNSSPDGQYQIDSFFNGMKRYAVNATIPKQRYLWYKTLKEVAENHEGHDRLTGMRLEWLADHLSEIIRQVKPKEPLEIEAAGIQAEAPQGEQRPVSTNIDSSQDAIAEKPSGQESS